MQEDIRKYYLKRNLSEFLYNLQVMGFVVVSNALGVHDYINSFVEEKFEEIILEKEGK